MKALSLWQPFASLMALDLKTIETRGWYMAYRGPLVIAATKTWNRDVLEALHVARLPPICDGDSDWRVMLEALAEREVGSLGELPLGAALCIVDVVGCATTDAIAPKLSERELAFGDYAPGRFGIVTRNLRTFKAPIPCKGKQGLWEFDDELIPREFQE
jgi:hypothetical protein